MGTYRYVYNFTVARINKEGDKSDYMTNRKAWTAMLPPWVKTNGRPAHYKSIRFLLRFDCVILPVFNGGEMARKAKRKIRAKSVRSMLTFAHSVFLLHKAFIAGKRVILMNESYTSKTANWTGEIKQNLGGAKFIRSEGVKIDRDINGALGIFLKGLVGSTFPGNRDAVVNVC